MTCSFVYPPHSYVTKMTRDFAKSLLLCGAQGTWPLVIARFFERGKLTLLYKQNQYGKMD